jgi:3-oxoacyl-[acyl-carrier protein] reductase
MGALTGRCALVVGGAGGIGGGIAEAFLAEGAKVVIADFNEEVTANRAKEIGSLGVAIDVTNEASVKAGVAKATQLLGQIDILVNSAGIATQAPVVDMTLELWNETIAVDLSGVFLVTHHVLPQMLTYLHLLVLIDSSFYSKKS